MYSICLGLPLHIHLPLLRAKTSHHNNICFQLNHPRETLDRDPKLLVRKLLFEEKSASYVLATLELSPYRLQTHFIRMNTHTHTQSCIHSLKRWVLALFLSLRQSIKCNEKIKYPTGFLCISIRGAPIDRLLIETCWF